MNFSLTNKLPQQKVPNLNWHISRLLRKTDVLLITNCLLITAAFAMFYVLNFQQKPALADLQKQLITAQALHKTANVKVVSTQSSDLQTFFEYFPKLEALADELGLLFELANADDLEIDKAQYKLIEKSGGLLRRFEVTFPISGHYAEINHFVAEVLKQLPSVALSEITLEREDISEKMIKANLRFVFFIRKGL